MKIWTTLVALLLWASWIRAEDHPRSAAAPAHGKPVDTAAAHDAQHPVISDDGAWAGSVVIVVLGLFLAAAVIGPIVRANMPEDVPLESHDEPPGSSGHHGASGTEESGHGHGHH
jgi:hypothetical protein